MVNYAEEIEKLHAKARFHDQAFAVLAKLVAESPVPIFSAVDVLLDALEQIARDKRAFDDFYGLMTIKMLLRRDEFEKFMAEKKKAAS